MRNITRNIGGFVSTLAKISLVVIVLAIGVLVYQSCSGSPIVKRIDSIPPSEARGEALIPVSTHTHVYEVRKAVANPDGSVTISGWYVKEGGMWGKIHLDTVTLPPVLQPQINK